VKASITTQEPTKVAEIGVQGSPSTVDASTDLPEEVLEDARGRKKQRTWKEKGKERATDGDEDMFYAG